MAKRQLSRSRKIDPKINWPKGPWMKEDDQYHWIDPKTGFYCMINRGPVGALCGYIGVDETHPYYGMNYDEAELNCHGGLTYCGELEAQLEMSKDFLDYVPFDKDAPKKIWIFGFDCAHSGDTIPKLGSPILRNNVYRNVRYVKKELTGLAEQLAALDPSIVLVEQMKKEIGL